MAKNNNLINQYKYMYRVAQDTLPKTYAAIAIALHRKGMEFDDINEIFAMSQEIWMGCMDEGTDVVKLCSDETGIDILRTTNEPMS